MELATTARKELWSCGVSMPGYPLQVGSLREELGALRAVLLQRRVARRKEGRP